MPERTDVARASGVADQYVEIAAICRAHSAACATRNTKDFAQAGVELGDPWND